LSAILRLADELADGKERSSKFMLELEKCKGVIPDESKIYHVFSHCLNSCYLRLDSHTVYMKFFLNKESVLSKYNKEANEIFLIDEIYDRTLKVFTECLYYNRFVPEYVRINMVDVCINFLCSETLQDFYAPINYRLKENGYPVIFRKIFEICKDELVKNGLNIDGQYVANQINE
jgi:hypothetical protein